MKMKMIPYQQKPQIACKLLLKFYKKIKDQDKKQTQAIQQAEIEYRKLLAINTEQNTKIIELDAHISTIEMATATTITAELNLVLIDHMKQLRIDLKVDAERRSETQAISRAMVTVDEARAHNNQQDTLVSPPPFYREKT